MQGDPFAAPSRVRVRVPLDIAGFRPADLANPVRAVGLRDFLARALADACDDAPRVRGSGSSGRLASDRPGPQVLERTAVVLDGAVEGRLTVGLPAQGRRILGRAAAELLCDVLPVVVRALLCASHDAAELGAHLDALEDARALRAQLAPRGLVAFVADGAVLPRRSGVDDRPLPLGAVPFASPASLRVALATPHAGEVRGMGIPQGVTLIVGGGYHGKSTLLSALALGVYDHAPGDGRERVVTVESAVAVRAEDGRPVAGVDISAFLGALPQARDTASFHTADASGSTSQSAAIAEAVEAGCDLLLLDEDTSATNLLVRDRRMQLLVAKDAEPITPLIDRVRALARAGTSTLLVVGASGDWFDVADTVIGMEEFATWDATERARAIAAEHPTARAEEATGWTAPRPRVVVGGVDLRRGRRDVSVRARGVDALEVGEETIDLSAVAQLVHPSQVRALGEAMVRVAERVGDGPTVSELLDALDGVLARGVDALSDRPDGDLAAFRRQELAAALSRLRGLQVGRFRAVGFRESVPT